MRPVSTSRSELRYPFDVLLGTKAQVRVLRFLVESDRAVTPTAIQENTGISLPGAIKVLDRLVRAGFVSVFGSGRSKTYSLDPQDPLSNALRLLFEGERDWYQELVDRLSEAFSDLPQPVNSAWLTLDGYTLGDKLSVSFLTHPRVVQSTLETVKPRLAAIEQEFDLTIEVFGLTKADLLFHEATRITMLSGYSPFEDSSEFSPASHYDLDARSLELANRLVQMIRRNPTLITRAKRYVDRKLDNERGRTRTDLSEWKQILDGFSLRRLERLLVDPGERATRLRQSAPFYPVLTDEEKHELRTGERP